jgi:hypothetical protein
MVISGIVSSSGVLRGSSWSQEGSEIDPISNPSDLVTIAAPSEPSGRVFSGTLIGEIWGGGEVELSSRIQSSNMLEASPISQLAACCERACRAAETAQWIDETVFVAAEREGVDWVR